MEDKTKLAIAMEIIEKKITALNIKLSENSDPVSENKLNYLLNLKNLIYSGSFDGIDEFLEKYKEDKL